MSALSLISISLPHKCCALHSVTSSHSSSSSLLSVQDCGQHPHCCLLESLCKPPTDPGYILEPGHSVQDLRARLSISLLVQSDLMAGMITHSVYLDGHKCTFRYIWYNPELLFSWDLEILFALFCSIIMRSMKNLSSHRTLQS